MTPDFIITLTPDAAVVGVRDADDPDVLPRYFVKLLAHDNLNHPVRHVQQPGSWFAATANADPSISTIPPVEELGDQEALVPQMLLTAYALGVQDERQRAQAQPHQQIQQAINQVAGKAGQPMPYAPPSPVSHLQPGSFLALLIGQAKQAQTMGNAGPATPSAALAGQQNAQVQAAIVASLMQAQASGMSAADLMASFGLMQDAPQAPPIDPPPPAEESIDAFEKELASLDGFLNDTRGRAGGL